MTDRPIIFSGLMVRAPLRGTKTQTRRLATSPLARCQPGDRLWVRESAAVRYSSWHHEDGHKHAVTYAADEDHGVYVGLQHNAYGSHIRNGEAPSVFPSKSHNADGSLRWCPAIHMPRWASRLTPVADAVRREVLQDISDEDALAEGIEEIGSGRGRRGRFYGVPGLPVMKPSPREAFRALWELLHGPGSWEANPELVAITSTVHRWNIDQMGKPAS